MCRSQWLRNLRCRSAAAHMLRLWVRIPPVSWIFVCCECCVLSGRGLCEELITRPEESYPLWCVVLCNLDNSCMRRPWPTGGLLLQKLKNKKKIEVVCGNVTCKSALGLNNWNWSPSCGNTNCLSTHCFNWFK